MDVDYESALERIAATLIEARSELEHIRFQKPELNELHSEITRAYALCWRIAAATKQAEPEQNKSCGASA